MLHRRLAEPGCAQSDPQLHSRVAVVVFVHAKSRKINESNCVLLNYETQRFNRLKTFDKSFAVFGLQSLLRPL